MSLSHKKVEAIIINQPISGGGETMGHSDEGVDEGVAVVFKAEVSFDEFELGRKRG